MIEKVTRNLREVITEDELRNVMAQEHRRAYIGFEPSGLVHLGWLMCADKIKDLVDAGFDVTILLADWHAWINDKLGGNMEAIQICGEYIKDAFNAMGVKNVTYLYAREMVSDPEYWHLVLQIAKQTSLARAKRAMDIMGRKAEDAEKDISKFFYPLMQAADIFYLKVDAALGGMDQRHAHMLARDVCTKLGKKKPVALHTPIISSLQAKERMDAKMSKSKPESAIFIHDDRETIRRKLKKAYCPEGAVEGNPVLETARHILFMHFDALTVERKYEGEITFKSYEELEDAYVKKTLHPLDLKGAVADYLEKILAPVRDYFIQHPQNLKRLQEYMKK
ncbi:MAG: tyrosine--tRNA ligase [Thermoplasmata archaeon]|nr:MAG: tyrosine--tRNA ligase [Thermoplasmata archaeon]RLF41471.1 MAG: tyrosine--tRNA ligase [Thermoplasmata archaeon]HDN51449.1 tyrosine--tRNA ligase [Thermoplasmatales archaeon]